ncbi:MAG TPA: arylsulfotransferase family protein [Gemmata sp.]|jgi:hypothetical protein|nr:arylsulfotransferase family protein [Gemmata sp.]
MFRRRDRTQVVADPAKKENAPETAGKCGQPYRQGLFFRLVFLFGMVSLSYILGASAIYFDLPSSTFLKQAFTGAVAWYKSRSEAQATDERLQPLTLGKIDRAEKTCDGFTLCMYGTDSRAMLVNMLGEVVHQWHVPFSEIWSEPPHLRGRIENASVYFNDGHLYPNGDLLVVVEGPINSSNSSNGYGLVKLDKDSRVLWKYAEHCHHDVDVGADGTIYAIVNEIVEKIPQRLEYIPTPCMVDHVDVISPEGKRLKRIRILEAFQESSYAPLLGMFERPKPGTATSPGTLPAFRQDEIRRDVLHTNAIKVLSEAMAPRFPLFRAGQILISPRQLDAIAVIDPDSAKVVWASRGPWRSQHDPSFLENGHLLLFDNLGSSRGSRVLEFDPQTLAFPWSYPGEVDRPFFSQIRGMSQRLPNGNTLIVNSVGCEVFEVTPQRDVVWSCSSGQVTLNRARRYTADQLQFLKGAQRARP